VPCPATLEPGPTLSPARRASLIYGSKSPSMPACSGLSTVFSHRDESAWERSEYLRTGAARNDLQVARAGRHHARGDTNLLEALAHCAQSG
jgi:hypothetical protein